MLTYCVLQSERQLKLTKTISHKPNSNPRDNTFYAICNIIHSEVQEWKGKGGVLCGVPQNLKALGLSSLNFRKAKDDVSSSEVLTYQRAFTV